MATLLSEDENVKSKFQLIFEKDQVENKEAISWIPYKIILQSGEKELIYSRKKNNTGAGDYVLALTPINEIDNLIEGIKNFINSKNSTMFSFEAVEPSFELIFERAHRGYSLTCWIDAGNVISDHYTWDGFGIRFFTSENNINLFVEQLIKEKEDLFSNA